ncbi:MAG: porin [Candidatus Zixiibacteriota bacterium]
MRLLRFSVFSIILLSTGLSGSAAAVDPVQIFNADSSSSLRFQFVGQLRTSLESKDSFPGNDRSYDVFTEFRRIRLTFSGYLWKPELTYKLHLSTAPGSLELMDLYLNYKLRSELQIRYGQFKIPFTRYRIQSFQCLTFTDWAIVSKYFGAERQIGLAAHNGFEKPPRWGYTLGIFTGQNARASHGVGIAEVYDVDTPNPSDLTDPASTGKYHPEIAGHVSLNSAGIDLQSDSDPEKGPLCYSIALSGIYDFDPDKHQDFALRAALETLIKYRGGSLTAVGYVGNTDLDDDSKKELAMTGGLIQTAYRLNRAWELSLRYALVDFKDVLLTSARNLIAAEAGVTAGEIAIPNREEELTAGFNIYLDGHNLKIQNDFSWLRHVYNDDALVDFSLRSQVQLAF